VRPSISVSRAPSKSVLTLMLVVTQDVAHVA
jgi:hypothetical protein